MKLEDLKKVCEAATTGAWLRKDHGLVSESLSNGAGEMFYISGDLLDCDAVFIAAAREAMPRLIAVAEAASVVAEGFRRFYDEDEQLLVDALAAVDQ